jgi:hypothetical protein
MKYIENLTIISNLVWYFHHHMILIFISLAIPKQALITTALKITLKIWSRCKDVPYKQWVFSIPKRLRIYFLYDRKLLAKLSKCAWNVITAYLKSTVPYDDAVPGASIAVQTYGDFLNFNPHML